MFAASKRFWLAESNASKRSGKSRRSTGVNANLASFVADSMEIAMNTTVKRYLPTIGIDTALVPHGLFPG